MIRLDETKARSFVSEADWKQAAADAEAAAEVLKKRTGAGNDFLGWLDLPENYDKDEFARIQAAAEKIRRDSEVLVVVGIGGSYLGARAAIELLQHPFAASMTAKERGGPQIVFAGNQLSSAYLNGLKDLLVGRRFSVNVISKSGTTTEPAVTFRILKRLLEEQAGKEEAAKRIYATTDKAKGALKTLADSEGYETFVVPDDVGGRYSVLTAVGLLPIAAAGIDICALMEGARRERKRLFCAPFEENDALRYAALRNALYRGGKKIEIIENYEPSLHYLGEWWKQLYGESEGKDGKGIFPASADLTTDLHSMGQYIQDGERILMETVISVDDAGEPVLLTEEKNDLDGLNYLAGRTLDFVNESAMKGTALAHTDGGVPVSLLHMAARNEESLGELFYFFEYACGVSGYMLGVDPFDQPGVEGYKKNMFALLGKPGYEDRREELLKRL